MLRLFLCIALLLVLACKSGKEYSASRKPSVKSTPQNSGANVWLVSKRSEKYYHRQSKTKASTAKVVDNVTFEQWSCPGSESARYMPRSTKMKIRQNMRLINNELDGSQSNAGKVISEVVLKKGRGKNR